MIGAAEYPITLAEMPGYASEADKLFRGEEHEKMKTFLAVHPELGEKIAGTNGVRQLHWQVGSKKGKAQIVYYFRDLNMPLYLVAVCGPGDHVDFDEPFRQQLTRLVDELVTEHSKQWDSLSGRLDPIA